MTAKSGHPAAILSSPATPWCLFYSSSFIAEPTSLETNLWNQAFIGWE